MITRTVSALFISMVFLSLTACNDSSENKNTPTDTAAAASPETPPPASTIVTNSENIMVIRMKVANYDKWLTTYEERDSARRAAGLHNYVIGRGLMDSNMVLVALKADDTARAMAYTKEPALKAAMQKGGVSGKPKIDLMTAVWQDTAMLSTPLRSVNNFTVKDWNSWRSHFETGNQQRIDNGLAVRIVGHAAGDNHKVTVVTALVDSTKALNYFKSDDLKKRMQEGGVIGQPDRFLFTIVKRY